MLLTDAKHPLLESALLFKVFRLLPDLSTKEIKTEIQEGERAVGRDLVGGSRHGRARTDTDIHALRVRPCLVRVPSVYIHHPFTAPAVKPRTNSFIVNRKINTNGIAAIEKPAIIRPHSFTYSPSSRIRPTGKSCLYSSVINTKG